MCRTPVFIVVPCRLPEIPCDSALLKSVEHYTGMFFEVAGHGVVDPGDLTEGESDCFRSKFVNLWPDISNLR